MRREVVIYLCLASASYGAGMFVADWIDRTRDQAVPCTMQRPDFSGTWRLEPCASARAAKLGTTVAGSTWKVSREMTSCDRIPINPQWSPNDT